MKAVRQPVVLAFDFCGVFHKLLHLLLFAGSRADLPRSFRWTTRNARAILGDRKRIGHSHNPLGPLKTE